MPLPPPVPSPDARRRRGVAAVAATLAGALLPGCGRLGSPEHLGPTAPRAAPVRWAGASPRRLAVVLSSGGPRGFAHIGVLKALAELGVRPDLVVGASVGALVGGLLASGRDAAALEAFALELTPTTLVSLSLSGSEWLSGEPIAERVNELAAHRPIEALPLPFVAVAARHADQAVTGFAEGDLGVAVQASCAIVGRFSPVRIRGDAYVDPDLVAPMPVRLARALGARRVIAVDVSAHEDKAPPGSQRYRDSDRRKRELTEPDARAADVVVHPEFDYWVSLSQAFRQRSIAAGYRDALAQAARLRELALD